MPWEEDVGGAIMRKKDGEKLVWEKWACDSHHGKFLVPQGFL